MGFNFWLGLGLSALIFWLIFSKIASLKHPKMVRFGRGGPQSSSQNCSKTGGLILTSSWPLGALLDASGAEKKILGAALGRSKRNLKRGFSYLGAKALPKGSPGDSKMGSQIGSGLEKAKSQKMQYLSHENLDF